MGSVVDCGYQKLLKKRTEGGSFVDGTFESGVEKTTAEAHSLMIHVQKSLVLLTGARPITYYIIQFRSCTNA